jgi:DHA2 family multidrug resistance protein
MSERRSTAIPWISLGAVMVGAFMVALDQTIITLALPRIGAELRAVDSVDAVITVYLLALGVVQPTTGWLADRFGRRRVFLGSLMVFTLGSALSGLAADLPQLVAARVLQGAGGGGIFPVGMAMIYEEVPPARRGTAMGAWSLGINVAPMLGPALGGLIVGELGWRWLFLVNVPIGLAAIVVGLRVLRPSTVIDSRGFDGVGFGLVTVGLAAVLVAASEAEHGPASPVTIVAGVGGLALLVAFAAHELRHPNPLIDVRMFAIPEYRTAVIVVAVMISATMARLVFLPLQLVTVRGMPELQVGLLLTPAAIANAVSAPLAGVLTDRLGARLPVVGGLVTMAVASVLLANLAIDTPELALAGIVALHGFGNGLALTPNAVAGMNALPREQLTRGTAIRSTTRQVAASLSVAGLTAFLITRLGSVAPPPDAVPVQATQDAYNALFAICAVALVACAVLALRSVPGGERMRANVAAREVERAERPVED